MLISDFFRVTPEKPLFFGSDNLCILQQEHQRIHPCKEPDCPGRHHHMLPEMYFKVAWNRKGQGAE
jgi:hypothetical protein